MIDLRNKGLPDAVEVGGSPFLINTDFREWLKFGEIIKNSCTLEELEFLFVDCVPLCDYSGALFDFFNNPNSTPTGEGDSERIIDYIQDGEYIVGSFMAVYGIDLTTVEMHWHLFKALFLSLPESCKIKEIMSYRSYRKQNKKEETVRHELKEAWRLPDDNQNKAEALQEANDLFYNA